MNSLRRAIGYQALPEVKDPNFYCKVCKLIYPDKEKYWNHLRNKHDMDPEAPTFDDGHVVDGHQQQQPADEEDIKLELQDEPHTMNDFNEEYDDLDDDMIKLEVQEVLYEDEDDFGFF